MRWISGLAIGCAVSAVVALSGCSGQEGLPAIAVNSSGPSTALIQADQASEPNTQLAPIPDTADSALRAILEGLHENRPDAVWDALPASYQHDVNDLVHLFVARMHPEAWKWFVQIARKGAIVLRLPLDEPDEASETVAAGAMEPDSGNASAIEQVSVKDRTVNSRDENTRLQHLLGRSQSRAVQIEESQADQRRREAVARVFDQIADAGPTGLEKLKTADVGALLRGDAGRTLVDVWRAAAETEYGNEDLQDILALIDDPSKVRFILKESTAETAVVEIIFPNDVPGEIECVRVDNKWLPRLFADAWTETISNLKRGVLESLPSETAAENFGAVFQYLGMIELSFDGELAHARADADNDDDPAGAHRSALLGAPMMVLEYLIVGPRPAQMDELQMDADGILLNLPPRSDMSSEDDSRSSVSIFEQLAGKSLVEDGQRVAVLCHSTAEVQAQHPNFAAGVIEEVSRRFKAGKINVVEAENVVVWAKNRAGLTVDSDLTALATEHEAGYIVQFHIETLGFAEENFPELRRGRANGQVAVIEMTTNENGEKRSRVIFRQPFESKYPSSAPVAADAEEADAFKQRYLARLHYELSRPFLREP